MLFLVIERQIHVAPAPDSLARDAAARVLAAAADSIAAKGTFSIALSGGSTPKALYALLASDEFKSQTDWSHWDIYWGDERCVGPDDKESNYKMANDALLTKVPVKKENIHRMKGEYDPNAAAREYGQLLQSKFADGGLDLILLGMGPDGHTLSLFPGSAALNETHHRCVANWVEKFKTFRITMTAPFANKARQIMVLVAGADKRDRVTEVLEGPHDPQRLPIQFIDPAPNGGRLVWLMDAEAAGM